MFSMERFLVIGGTILLTVLILNFSRSDYNQSTASLNNEAIVTAISICQSMLEEIQTRAFDEATVSTFVTDPSELSNVVLMGKESGEVDSTQFDDVDDFNGYLRTFTLPRLGDFDTSVDIYYIDEANPDNEVFVKTFTKRIDISITNAFLPDTLVINKIISY